MNIPPLVLATAETTINQALDLDPLTRERVRALDGRVIAIALESPAIELFILPDNAGVMLLGRYEGEPDLRLRGPLSALFHLARRQGGIPPGITIEGDAGLATELQAIAAGLDLDWEEQLSRLAGDGIAHQTGRAVRGGAQWLRQTGDTLALNLQEFLKEEAHLLPQPFEVADWVTEVDRLRDDSARLEARLARLEQARRKAG